LSLELIIKALVSLGLSRLDAKVYVYIAKMGSQTAKDLDGALNYSKNQIYKSLRLLTAKTLVTKKGIKFSAIPFEEALDLLIERKKKQANHIKESKKELLVNWKNED
jgi:sugar-specific transcriptional regulator TrmB